MAIILNLMAKMRCESIATCIPNHGFLYNTNPLTSLAHHYKKTYSNLLEKLQEKATTQRFNCVASKHTEDKSCICMLFAIK